MKITVFNGSPRGRTSNSHLITQPLLEGAREAGAETEEIFLVEKNIEQCAGCFSCWGVTPGGCVHNDDMAPLIDLFIESDYVGMATPVYGMLMTAILKKFTERLLPLNTPHIRRNDDGSFYHEGRVRRFPRMFIIANAGFPGEHNFELLKAYMALQDPVLEIYRNCGELLRNADKIASDEGRRRIADFYGAVRCAGGEMVESGAVSAETLERIHAELMSDDEYMAAVNESWDEGEMD